MSNSHDSLFERAVAAFRGGDPVRAKTLCREALAAEPQRAMAHHLMGVLEQGAGDLDAAMSSFLEAVRLDPELGNAHYNLGVVFERLGCDADAQSHYETALRLTPDRFDALTNLGNVLFRAGRHDAALSCLRRAVRQQPDHPVVHVSMSNVLRKLHDVAGARQALDRALELDPAMIQALANLAALNEETNDIAAARSAAERALALDPGHAGANMLLARCDRRDGDLAAALSRLEAVDDADEPKGVRRDVAYEKAVLFDRLERPAEAFAAMVESNRCALTLQPDTEALADRFLWRLDQIVATVEGMPAPDRASEVPVGETPDPVFVVGFPRSGTTLLGQVLDCHSGLVMAEERPFLQDLIPGIVDYPGGLANLDGNAIGQLRRRYFTAFEAEVERSVGERPVHKFPLDLIHGGLIRTLFPDAPLVLAIRHPCDVVLSCFLQKFRANEAMANFYSLERAARTYEKVMRVWDLQRSRFAIEPLIVRYEDVVEDFDREVGRLLAGIGVPWEDGVRAFDRKARDREAIHTPSYAQVAEPLYDRAVFRWHRYADRMRPVVELLRPWIERYGYDDASAA